MTLAWTLRVQIEDARNFDLDLSQQNPVSDIGIFLRCVFNNCVNQTSIVRLPINSSSPSPELAWNEALEWQFDDKTLKKLKKIGSSIKLQIYLLPNWESNTMPAFPIKHFSQNKKKYELQEIGYIVLDLKNALLNGSKLHNINDVIPSKYLRLRNTKLLQNKGIYPEIKIAFWCNLRPKWKDIPHTNIISDEQQQQQQTNNIHNTHNNARSEATVETNQNGKKDVDHIDDEETEEKYVSYQEFAGKSSTESKDNIDSDFTDECEYKYRIGIDIRSVRDLQKCFNIQCEYKYNLFDNGRKFHTLPPIFVSQCEEKPITNGFCAYELILQSNKLCNHFVQSPLMIQCTHKSVDTNDVEIGWAFINLSELLSDASAQSDKRHNKLRYIDRYYTIYSIKQRSDSNQMHDLHEIIQNFSDLNQIQCKPMGNLRVCCSLETITKTKESKVQKTNLLHSEQIAEDTENTVPIPQSLSASTTSYIGHEIMEELKRWKSEQQQKWQKRWNLLETEKLRQLENEWQKQEQFRSEQLNKKKFEIIKLEKKLKTSLYDIECQEKKLKLEQLRIEERKRELEQSYKLKTNEVVASIKRLRNDHKFEVEALNRTIKFLKNENDLIVTKYTNEEKRCNELRTVLNAKQKKFDTSSVGMLQIENDKLNNKLMEMTEKLNEKTQEIQSLNGMLNEYKQKLQQLHIEMVESEKKQIDKEKKQMERLKVELLTKSHFKQLRNDRNELQQIKQKLNNIMNQQP